MRSFTFLFLLALLTSFTSSQQQVHYVIPSDGPQDCPSGEDCHLLSYYAKNLSMLRPVAELAFLNGEYLLEEEVTLNGFDFLALVGLNGEWSEGPHESTMQSSVIIRCTNNSIVAFNITSIYMLGLINLTVTGCKTAISLNNVTEFVIIKVSIQNSTSSGISYNKTWGKGIHGVGIGESSFYQNCLHPPTDNGYVEECCHLQLIIHEYFYSQYNITNSNFSFGNNLYASLCLKIPHKHNDDNEGDARKTTLGVTRSLFLNNTGSKCGGLLLESSDYIECLILIRHSVFLHNKVLNKNLQIDSSGGMSIITALSTGSTISIYKSLFQENLGGGASINVYLLDEIQFLPVTISVFHSIFSKNSNQLGAGFKIITKHANFHVEIVNTIISYNNHGAQLQTVRDHSALYIFCVSSFSTNWLENVTVSHNSMTGVYVTNCRLTISGRTSVISNNTSNFYGGGLLLGGHSQIYSVYSGKIVFSNNRAGAFGGAIFSDANPFPNNVQSMISSSSECTLTGLDATFINNTAGLAGNDIYGGLYYSCHLNQSLGLLNSTSRYFKSSFYFCSNRTFQILSNIMKPISSSVSSAPLGVCLCTDASTTDCAIRSMHRKLYPGSVLTLSLAVVGMCGGITPDALATTTYDVNVTLGNANQQTNTWKCKEFSYFVKQVDQQQSGFLVIERSGYNGPNSSLFVGIQFFDCPSGFILVSGFCSCNPVIGSINNVTCNISWADTPVRRSGNVWLSYDTQYNCTIANENCPFDYCNSSTVYLSLDYPDTQCTLNRSGTLCGECLQGLSLMLGSNRCTSCDNKYISFIVLFIFAGIALVAFLLVCNLTVSVGSINGLLFYANIIKLNEVVYFSNGVKVPVLSQFIAWLNLDLGIETCFFNGLDGYWKMWLQFFFPTYIWLLVGVIIIGSYYSGKLSRIFGNNTVPVLATLILMSYSKLLRNITNALMISRIRCDGEEWSVWSVDANIQYFSSKHLFLFGVSVLFLLVGILYGGMVFSAQWLQKCTGRYCKSSHDPMVKLKPLVDSYTGPYKDKYRFWTGLLIFIRVILTALFSYTMSGINNYIIVFVCALLIIVAVNGVYRNAALNNLELFHYFNLFSISLLTALFNQLQWINARLYLSSASVSFSILLFIGTILTNIYATIEIKYGRSLCFKRKFTEDNNNFLQKANEERERSPNEIIQSRESMIYDVEFVT